ncbi:YggS family pyridoxal phosphate-dependent enzyme [Mariniblastus sp.]|nr:YggS family pyridoxal phosphate-dependent enzyme [Mariniblastus sp.]
MNQQFRQNISDVNGKIADAAAKAGRAADEVTLVGVTKYVDAKVTREFAEAGHLVLGENRPQQLWQKQDELVDLNIEWHLIGHLQRNKAKRTVEIATLIHSVDSLRLLKAIDGHASDQSKVARVLLEVNVSGEEAKHGFAAEQLPAIVEAVGELKATQVGGLMAMAGLAGDQDDARREFASLRELAEQTAAAGLPANVQMKELSMGMSGDFEIAIEEGATLVRVGSALFA